MKRVRILIFSVMIAFLAFIGLVMAEKNVVKITPTIKVLYCIKDVTRQDPPQPLSSKDFTQKDVPINFLNIGSSVKSLNEINGMYPKEDIYAGEILNRNRIAKYEDIECNTLKPGEEEISIGFDSTDDCVGGIIRKDDVINIYLTNNITSSTPVANTECQIKGMRVIAVKDSNERYIDQYDKDTSAKLILLAGTPDQVKKIYDLESKGKLRISKVQENLTHNTTGAGVSVN